MTKPHRVLIARMPPPPSHKQPKLHLIHGCGTSLQDALALNSFGKEPIQTFGDDHLDCDWANVGGINFWQPQMWAEGLHQFRSALCLGTPVGSACLHDPGLEQQIVQWVMRLCPSTARTCMNTHRFHHPRLTLRHLMPSVLLPLPRRCGWTFSATRAASRAQVGEQRCTAALAPQ